MKKEDYKTLLAFGLAVLVGLVVGVAVGIEAAFRYFL